jgi:hypothetical protein
VHIWSQRTLTSFINNVIVAASTGIGFAAARRHSGLPHHLIHTLHTATSQRFHGWHIVFIDPSDFIHAPHRRAALVPESADARLTSTWPSPDRSGPESSEHPQLYPHCIPPIPGPHLWRPNCKICPGLSLLSLPANPEDIQQGQRACDNKELGPDAPPKRMGESGVATAAALLEKGERFVKSARPHAFG